MQIKKIAIKNLQNKKNKAESTRLELISNLNNDEKFKNLYLKRKQLIIQQAKAEFNNTSFDENELKACESSLKKFLTPYSNNPLLILQPTILCKHCNDNYYLEGKPCSCLKNEMSKIFREESGLNKFFKFNDADFSLFKDSEKIKKIYSMLEKWCNKPFDNAIKNFGFFGHTGTGKTFLMQCMADRLIEKNYFVYFTTAFNLHKNLVQYHTENNNELLQKFIECDILFIDDLGTENFIKNITENYLYTIINQRMINNKPTIFSTNLDLNGIFERYGERIFSRLVNKTSSKVFWFDNQDLRLKNKR